MSEHKIKHKIKLNSINKEFERPNVDDDTDVNENGLYSSSVNHNPALKGNVDFDSEAHIKYPLFYLINIRYLEKEDASKKVEVMNYFSPITTKSTEITLAEKSTVNLNEISTAAAKLHKKWKREAIKSFQDAYSDFVRMRMTRVDRNGERIYELMRKDDMEILPSLPSEEELFYEFVEIFDHRDLFNDYDNYDKRVNVNKDQRLNWFEHLFFYQKGANGEEKGDIRAEHARQGDDFLGHRLKILNVRY